MAFSIIRGAIALGGLTGGILLAMGGCAMTSGSSASTAPAATMPSFFGTPQAEKGGAELWAQSCSHCHNLRSPSTYGPYQWEVAVYDMRVRANLTGEEQRKILAFLKAASQ